MSRTYYSSGEEFDSDKDDNSFKERDDSDMDVDDLVDTCSSCSCSEVNEVLSDDSVDTDDLFTVWC